MTDETPTTRPRKRQDEEIQDAVVVDETDQPVEQAAETAEAAASPAEPATETVVAEPVTETPAEPAPRIVYIQAPAPPVKQGNRGFGVLMAVLGAVLFAALYGVVSMLLKAAETGVLTTGHFLQLEFYIPVALFLVGFIVLVLITNRAAWWAYILGSLVLGVVVYLGTIGIGLLMEGALSSTAQEVAALWYAGVASPSIIAAGLLAREVSMWLGVAIARRGRKLKERNVERRAAWEREVAEQRAEHERAASGAAPTAV